MNNQNPYRKNFAKKYHRASKPRVRSLSPLLSDEEKQTANIQDLSYDFACRIVRMYQYLTEDAEYKEYIMSKQVFRSGTSIAANISEAQHAQSKQDFLAKMSIASKEANETTFWLRLLHDNGYLSKTAYDSIINDCHRVRNKIRAITKTTRENIENNK